MNALPAQNARSGLVAAKALCRAATSLAIKQDEVAVIIGLSPSSVSRLGSGQRQLDLSAKEGELGLLLLRALRSLDALTGGSDDKSAAWLRSPNDHLGGAPLELMQTVRGLLDVADYLDALRGKV